MNKTYKYKLKCICGVKAEKQSKTKLINDYNMHAVCPKCFRAIKIVEVI